MTDKLSAAEEVEFNRLARFLKLSYSLLFQQLPSRSGNEHPYNALMASVQTEGKAANIAGLRMAVRDILEMSAQLGDEAVELLDGMLAQVGAATTTEVRAALRGGKRKSAGAERTRRRRAADRKAD